MEHVKRRYILAAVLLYCIIMLVLEYAGADIWLANTLFQLEGMTWSLKHHWLTEGVLHTGGRWLNYCGVIAVLTVTLYWHRHQHHAQKRPAIRRLCLSLALSFISVNYLKAITNIDCPWDLSMFGGDMPYIPLLADKPDVLPLARCFPAGHASAGYAWISLYYFFDHIAPHWKLPGLLIGLVAGLVFGIGQQLRGAHFLSHDLTTLFLCGLIAFVVFNYGNNSDNGNKRSARQCECY